MAKLILSNLTGSPVFFALSGDNTVLDDGAEADSLVVTSPPSRGKLVVRDDGKFDFNLNNDLDTTPITFSYNRTKGGVTIACNATINLTRPVMLDGWDLGGHGLLPVDRATNKVIVWPGLSSRLVHISTTGMSYEDIRTAEDGNGLNSGSDIYQVKNWLLANPVTSGPYAGVYYGSIPELALDQALGELLVHYMLGAFQSPWALFNRADTNFGQGLKRGQLGESKVHPQMIGAYGTGDGPYFSTSPFLLKGTSYGVMQDIKYGDSLEIRKCSFICLDGIYGDCVNKIGKNAVEFGGEAGGAALHMARDFALRRFQIIDAGRRVPASDRTVWVGHGDRASGIYASAVNGYILEEIFIDKAGWFDGYRGDMVYTLDGVTFWPRGSDIYSHDHYIQANTRGGILRNSWMSRPAGAGFQHRGGAIIDNVVVSFAGQGDTTGGGWQKNGNKGDERRAHWSMTDRYVKTEAGMKNYFSASQKIDSDSAGIYRYTETTAMYRTAVLNSRVEDREVFTAGDELGPKGFPGDETHVGGPQNFFAYVERSVFDGGAAQRFDRASNVTIGEWNPANYPNQFTNGLNTAGIQALALGEYAKTLLDDPSATYFDLCEHLRTLDDPISELENIQRHMLAPLGYMPAAARTTPQTVKFRQYATGTPGCRFDMAIDWDTMDLPGAVQGDSLDMTGHFLSGGYNPKNRIADFIFGAGGEAVWNAGLMDPSGDLVVDAGGNGLTVNGGAHFYIEGKTGGTLALEVEQGVFVNRGDLAGVDATFRYGSIGVLAYDGGSCTVGDGRTLTVYGHSQVGFEGDSGGAASLTVASGGTLAFKPSLRVKLLVSGLTQSSIPVGKSGNDDAPVNAAHLPVNGATISGENGNTARCVDTVFGSLASGDTMLWVYFDDLSGPVFANGEMLNGPTDQSYVFDTGTADISTVEGTYAPVMGQIAEIRSGMHGWGSDGLVVPPNVASSVVLESGSIVEVETGSLPAGTYDLIDVDSLTDNGATLSPGVARVGNKLVLTVS